MNIPSLYLTTEKIEKMPLVENEAEGLALGVEAFRFDSPGGQVARIGDKHFVIKDELQRPEPIRRKRLRKGSIDERYGLDLSSQGWDRSTKRRYVKALKKAMREGVKMDSPKYWAILGKYGFKPSAEKDGKK